MKRTVSSGLSGASGDGSLDQRRAAIAAEAAVAIYYVIDNDLAVDGVM